MGYIKILLVIFISIPLAAQTDSLKSSGIEISVIDSYITPELPHKFILSFSTSDSSTSFLVFPNGNRIPVSLKLSEDHKIGIELNKLKVDSSMIKYRVAAIGSRGKETLSEIYTVRIPEGLKISDEMDTGLLSICLGGIIYAIPSPSYVLFKNEHYWSISKEIPLFSFYPKGYNYPAGYISAEYSYISGAERKNFLRAGYKQIIQIPSIEYLSPGIGYFTDFKGYNGFSPEISLGLFQFSNVFTFYARYRYNFQIKTDGTDFHEFSIGLYAHFFSLNL